MNSSSIGPALCVENAVGSGYVDRFSFKSMSLRILFIFMSFGISAVTLASDNVYMNQENAVEQPRWFISDRAHFHTRLGVGYLDEPEIYFGIYSRVERIGGSVVIRHIKSISDSPPWETSYPDKSKKWVDRRIFELGYSGNEVLSHLSYTAAKTGVRNIYYYAKEADRSIQQDHPEWLAREVAEEGGEPIDVTTRSEGIYHLNLNTDYREVVYGRLGELLDQGGDGIYMDYIHFPLKFESDATTKSGKQRIKPLGDFVLSKRYADSSLRFLTDMYSKVFDGRKDKAYIASISKFTRFVDRRWPYTLIIGLQTPKLEYNRILVDYLWLSRNKEFKQRVSFSSYYRFAVIYLNSLTKGRGSHVWVSSPGHVGGPWEFINEKRNGDWRKALTEKNISSIGKLLMFSGLIANFDLDDKNDEHDGDYRQVAGIGKKVGALMSQAASLSPQLLLKIDSDYLISRATLKERVSYLVEIIEYLDSLSVLGASMGVVPITDSIDYGNIVDEFICLPGKCAPPTKISSTHQAHELQGVSVDYGNGILQRYRNSDNTVQTYLYAVLPTMDSYINHENGAAQGYGGNLGKIGPCHWAEDGGCSRPGWLLYDSVKSGVEGELAPAYMIRQVREND